MISFEEFVAKIRYRSGDDPPSPCYICGTLHSNRYLCDECWYKHIPSIQTRSTSWIEDRVIYKVIQDALAEILEKELLL